MALFVGDPSAPSRFGTDVADTSDNTGLFLKLFGGETYAAFSEKTHTADKHKVQEISSGKSHQFPKTWKVSAAYHTAGQEMLGQDTDETERIISIDGLLVSHIGIYDLDEAMSHFNVRSEYTSELGKALARVYDTNVYRTVVKTARADSSLGGGSASTSPFPDGTELLSADVSGTITATSGAQWWEVMRGLQVDADTANYDGKIWLAVPPATFDATMYSQSADSTANEFLFANRDITFGGQGGDQEMLKLRNVYMYQSNLIPQSDDSANGDVKAKYRADFSTTLGVAWGNQGVGTTKLIGMGLETTRDVRRQEDFIVAKIACGHGSLRNEITWDIRNT